MARKLFRWRRNWEYPRLPVVPARTRRRRFAASVALTAVFFAGAALAAGAGNQLARVAEDSTVAVSTDATTTDATTTDASVTAAEASPATTDPAATDPAATPTPPTTTAQPVEAADPVTDPTAAPEPATTEATAPPAPDPSDVTVTSAVPAVAPAQAVSHQPRRRPAVHRAVQRTPQKHAAPRQPQNLPLVVPYHAIAFDPQQWLNDNPGTPVGQAAVQIALNYLGVPYRWGGTLPTTGFDCSGLTRFVYAQLGINLVHYAASQFAAFRKLSPTQLEPGDLVFFEPKADGPGHVGLYIGHDEMIEAPHTGAVVRISSVSGAAAAMGFLGAVRPYTTVASTLTLLSEVEWGPAPAFIRLD